MTPYSVILGDTTVVDWVEGQGPTSHAHPLSGFVLLLAQLPLNAAYSFTPPKIAPGETSTLLITTTTSTSPGVHQLAITSQLVNLVQTVYPTLVIKQRLFLPVMFKKKYVAPK